MKIINQDLVLDGIDKQILDHLVENARTPILEIARKIGASSASVHKRVRKMEEIGVKSGSYIKINQEKLGYSTRALCWNFSRKSLPSHRNCSDVGRDTRSNLMLLYNWKLEFVGSAELQRQQSFVESIE